MVPLYPYNTSSTASLPTSLYTYTFLFLFIINIYDIIFTWGVSGLYTLSNVYAELSLSCTVLLSGKNAQVCPNSLHVNSFKKNCYNWLNLFLLFKKKKLYKFLFILRSESCEGSNTSLNFTQTWVSILSRFLLFSSSWSIIKLLLLKC